MVNFVLIAVTIDMIFRTASIWQWSFIECSYDTTSDLNQMACISAKLYKGACMLTVMDLFTYYAENYHDGKNNQQGWYAQSKTKT